MILSVKNSLKNVISDATNLAGKQSLNRRGREVCFKGAYLGTVVLHLTLECSKPNWISSWVTLSRFSGADVGQGLVRKDLD